MGLVLGWFISRVAPDTLLRQLDDPYFGMAAGVLGPIGTILLALGSMRLWKTAPPLLVGGVLILASSVVSAARTDEASGFPCVSYVTDESIEDDHQLRPGERFSAAWRLYNCGDVDLTGYSASRLRGQPGGTPGVGPEDIRMEQPFPPGSDAILQTKEIVAPMSPGCYRSAYRFRGPDGTFGDSVWMQFVVGPPGPKIDFALLVRHLNVNDETAFPPGRSFRKGFLIHNCGDNPWEGYRAVRTNGDMGPPTIDIPVVSPHQDVQVWAGMTAPLTPGTHFAEYRLVDAAGVPFGDTFAVRINVK